MEQTILERLQRNEEIARKFFEVESSILSIFNFKDLFERLLTEIREKFEIPYIWISMIQDNEVVCLIEELASSDLLKQRLNIVHKQTFLRLIGNHTKPLLINQQLSSFFKIFPQNEKYLVRSLAIAPITLNGEIIGSLNFGDGSSIRYSPGMDTSLLEQMAVKTSICLSNVIAHERMKRSGWKDPVTGLYNLRALESFLKREFKRSERYGGLISLIHLSIRNFNMVTERYGAEAGERLVEYTVEQLTGLSRDADILARIADDEFAILLPNTTSSGAVNLMKRLEARLEKARVRFGQQSIKLSVTLGIGGTGDSGVYDPKSLLERAGQMVREERKRREKSEKVVFFEHQDPILPNSNDR